MLTPNNPQCENLAKCFAFSRLLSLWDIMRIFDPSIFVQAAELFNSGRRPEHSFASRGSSSNPNFEDSENENETDEAAKRLLLNATFTRFEQICLGIGLRASAVTFRKMAALSKENDRDIESYRRFEPELRGRLIDEMKETIFFSLSALEGNYYCRPQHGWEEIISRFPDVRADVEEAHKCFALSRYAATTFHSLQIVEFGLIELGVFINVTDPKSGWTAVTGRLSAILKKPYKERTDFERANHDFLEQLQGTTEALKNAWRNKVSHAQGKLTVLTPDFAPEIAEEILFASRAFMRRLAEGLPDENL